MKPARRIVMFNRVSADGYFATPDDKLDWAVPDETLEREAAEELQSPGTILFGRKTYDAFEAFWPHVVEESGTAPDPHTPGRRTPELLAMAKWINEATKIVLSKRRKDVTWNNSRLVRTFDPRAIEDLKRQPGSSIMIFGSGSLVSQLTEHGLIDEYRFVVGALLLGTGRSLVVGVSRKVPLKLVEARPYTSGNVLLRYERAA